MSFTLGEKLRQAREERGFTISEVAEQTRISSLYLECIENDDYRILPGGIFNKGFVKSYAKFVGVSEQEALTDYASLLAQSEIDGGDEPKTYRPEVLTDDRSSASMVPTIIIAVVILGLMTAGILYLVNYLRQPGDSSVAANASQSNTNQASDTPTESEAATSSAPDMASLKIEFAAVGQPVSLSATKDGKLSSNVVTPGTAVLFEPKENLTLSYSRSLASAVQLIMNGKSITLPAVPLDSRRNVIEFEINKGNLSQIWTSGSISSDVPASMPNANVISRAPPAPTGAASSVRSTPLPRPSSVANRAAQPTPARTPVKPASTPRPTANTQ